MNHLAARQKEGDKLWHYTSSNKRTGTFPIGLCADGCPGHATAEEACEHYRQYLLSTASFREDVPGSRTLHRCEAETCSEYTSGSGTVVGGYTYFHLCRDHRNVETMSQLIKVGESYES